MSILVPLNAVRQTVIEYFSEDAWIKALEAEDSQRRFVLGDVVDLPNFLRADIHHHTIAPVLMHCTPLESHKWELLRDQFVIHFSERFGHARIAVDRLDKPYMEKGKEGWTEVGFVQKHNAGIFPYIIDETMEEAAYLWADTYTTLLREPRGKNSVARDIYAMAWEMVYDDIADALEMINPK